MSRSDARMEAAPAARPEGAPSPSPAAPLVPLLGAIGFAVAAAALLPTWQGAVPLVALPGFGFYALHGTLQTRATELAPAARGTAVSLFAFRLFVGRALGAAALGRVVAASGYGPAFLLSGLAVALLAARFAHRLRPPSAPAFLAADGPI